MVSIRNPGSNVSNQSSSMVMQVSEDPWIPGDCALFTQDVHKSTPCVHVTEPSSPSPFRDLGPERRGHFLAQGHRVGGWHLETHSIPVLGHFLKMSARESLLSS